MLIVCPHPDDGEALAHQLIIHGIKAGFIVHQLLATCDEYGTFNDGFKGKRIKRIRHHEMVEAAKAYGVDGNGTPLVKLHWMNYVDLHVPFSKASVTRLQNFIETLNPTIIAGPDPFLHFDGHKDHLATGRNYYVALENIKQKRRPELMLFFQTTKPDYFLPLQGLEIIDMARAAHKSQFSPMLVKLMHLMTFFFASVTLVKTCGHPAQGFRRVFFGPEHHEVRGIVQTVLKHVMGRHGNDEARRIPPSAKDLGLDLEPDGPIQ
nr:PIG-L family deacetylase [Candidatus Sigynarchaeota archaeon]